MDTIFAGEAFEQYVSDAQDMINQFVEPEDREGREDDITGWIADFYEDGSIDAERAGEIIAEKLA